MTPTCRRQCKACPWRVDCVPERDIPGGYSKKKHRALKSTIVEGLRAGPLRMMACHESTGRGEIVCVGWLDNQLGVGNNIALRMQAIRGALPRYELVGEQHQSFEETLPTD